MNCKFCNAELPEEAQFCHVCGKAQAEEVLCEEAVVEEQTPDCDVQEQPKKKVWPLVLAIVGSVVALGVLAVVLLTALGVNVLPRANDILKKDNYTVSADKAVAKADTVVATIGDKVLTNTQLQIYYRMQVVDFANYYSSYMSSLGLDFSKPLSEQTCYFDKNLTWEQYFLKIALETWQNYQTLAIMAEKNDHILGEDWQESLKTLPDELTQQATADGYKDATALLQEAIHPSCTLEEYLKHIELAYLSNDYYDAEYEKLMPTDEEVEKFFEEHAEDFDANGITKESGLISSVRHILVKVQGQQDEATGETTYTEEDWKACETEAKRILKEWQDGEATEESFIALVSKYTEDTASITNGGLYEGVYKDSGMTKDFQDWSIADVRKTGDVGLVKADYDHYKGYHIIYFVSGEPHWLQAARTNLLSERTTEMLENAKEAHPMKVQYAKISLAELKLG